MMWRPAQRGLSMIELMIAIVIAVLLGLGMVEVFSAQRAAFMANEALARVQENSRFALGFLERDLRMAGNMTCLNDLGLRGRVFNHLSPNIPAAAPWLYRIDQPLQVYEFVGTAPGDGYVLEEKRGTPAASAWNPPLPVDLGITGVALDGSDVVVMRYMSGESTALTGDGVNAATGELGVVDATFLQAGGIYAVSDCRSFSLFQSLGGGAVGQGGLNLVGWSGLENSYGPEVPVHRFEFVAYYVASGADEGPALFRTKLNADGTLVSEEMVNGVESMQLMLGADTNLRNLGDQPTTYFTASAIADGAAPWPGTSQPDERWSAVVAVRMGLLMRHQGRANTPQPATPFVVADTRLETADDARLRHVYEAQVAIRNRIRG